MDHASLAPERTAPLDPDAATRCRQVADTLLQSHQTHAVGLMGISPLDGSHFPLVTVGYPPAIDEHHASQRYTRRTPGVQTILRHPGVIHTWEDIPHFRDSYDAQAVYMPHGYRNGLSVLLASGAGRPVAMLHVSTRLDRLDPTVLNLVEEARPYLTLWTAAIVRFAIARLSAREREILALMRDGLSNGQIAETLVLSPRTVTTHVHHILQKLQAPNRTEAAVLAERYGLSP